MAEQNDRKRGRGQVEEEVDLPEVKKLREDLLENLEEEDDELCTASQDLDSFMRSFEEEIAASQVPPAVIDLTSESGESQPDLGYLFEASDDELGLPPSTASPSQAGSGEEASELNRAESDSSGLSDLWGFDEQVTSLDSFDFGVAETENANGVSGGEYVALDGLFDYTDLGFGSADFAWQPETLPAQ